MSFALVLRIALVLGLLIDLPVGAISLFAPQLVRPVFDVPFTDPIAVQFGGAEFLVVALVYAIVLTDPRAFRPLLWVVALDQFFAAVLPGLEVARGAFPASWKIVGAIPLSALLAIVFIAGALRRPTRT